MYVQKTDEEFGETTKLLLVDATPNIRSGFIKKVYGLVGMQLLITFGWMLSVSSNAAIASFVVDHPSINMAFVFSGLILMCPLIAFREKHPYNILLLFGFTICEAYMIGGVAAVYALQAQTHLVIVSLGLTVLIFGVLSAYVHATKRDLTFLESWLSIGLVVLVGMGLMMAFFPFSYATQVLLAGLGIALFSGYILYDTSTMIHYMTPDDAIVAAVQLYLDILNLFLCLLQLLSARE